MKQFKNAYCEFKILALASFFFSVKKLGGNVKFLLEEF